MTNKLRSVFGAFLERFARDTCGVTLALVALAASALIGFTGLGVETGLWYAIKRQDQSAADVAALSGALEVAASQSYADICAIARRDAGRNGFTPTGSCPANGCTNPSAGQMCVNNPPVLGSLA